MDERPAQTPIPQHKQEERESRDTRGVERSAPSTITQSLDEAAVRHIIELDAEGDDLQGESERDRRRPSLWSEDKDDFGEDSFASFVSELVSEDGLETGEPTQPPEDRNEADELLEQVAHKEDSPDEASEPLDSVGSEGVEDVSHHIDSEPSAQTDSELPRSERTTTEAIKALVRLATESRKEERQKTEVDEVRRRVRRSTAAPGSGDKRFEERRLRVSRTMRARVSALDSAIFAPKLQDSSTRAVYAAGWRAGLMKAIEALREVLEDDELRVSDLLELRDRLYTLAYGSDVVEKKKD